MHRSSSSNGSRKRRRILLLVMALVVVTGAGCESGPAGHSASTTKSGEQLVWGKAAEADVIDPAVAGTAGSWELLQLTYETLVDLDSNLRVVPRLAKSWRQTSATTYVFALRDD